MQVDLNKKKILITGATGTLGKILVKKLLKDYPFIDKLVVFSRDEYKQSKLASKYQEYSMLQFVIGDVRDKDKLIAEMKGIDIVIHAAAMKCLDVCERNPDETHKTNIAGTMNVIEAAIKNEVKSVLFISTDKAVEPISVYGESKAKGEELVLEASKQSITQFTILRLGNIFQSRGSVFGVFEKQAKAKKLIVFDRKSTRYLIRNKQLYNSILQSISIKISGVVVVPKLKSFKVIELAKAYCRECEITILPLRKGEREHEFLFSAAELRQCYEDEKYYYIIPDHYSDQPAQSFQKTKLVKPISSEKGVFYTIEELKKMISND